MTAVTLLNPHPPELERFLYAQVGEDRNGYVVTVLSALSRLGLDPWEEAESLTGLGQEAARARLGQLLLRSKDVPALGKDHLAVAQDLARLLPTRRPRSVNSGKSGSIVGRQLVTAGAIWGIIAIFMVLLSMLF